MKERKREPKPKQNMGQIFGKIWEYIRLTGQWAYKLRSVLLAIPVAVAAITLALRNATRLPEWVGLDMMANGEYAVQISRSVAILGPLAVTAVCLLLMFTSRRIVYPWLISVFSLVMPVVIWFINTYPA